MTNLEHLPASDAKGRITVVVETPKGATAKFKFDPKLGTFKYVRSLKGRLAYPFDWGFVPSTSAADGDPLDALVIHDDASFAGVAIDCYAVGILEVEQTEKEKTFRNDRVIFVPANGLEAVDVKAGRARLAKLKPKLEKFFTAAIAGTSKKLKYLGWRDDKAALLAVHAARTKFARIK